MVPRGWRRAGQYLPLHERIRFLHQGGGRHVEQHDGQSVRQAFFASGTGPS